MSQLSNFAENKIADFFRGQGITLPAAWHLALGSAADDSSFTEITGLGVTRASVTRSLANWAGTQGAGTTLASTGTSHTSSNNNPIDFGTPTGSATATHVGFYDNSSGGNVWFWFPLASPIVLTNGDPDPVSIDADGLSFSFGLIGGMSDYLSNKMIDLLWRAQSFTWPATIYLALLSVAPTNAGGGTEIATGGYARASLVPGLTSISSTQGNTSASSGTGGRISNLSAISFPDPTGDYTIQAEAVYDAPTVGNLLFWKSIGARSVVNGGPAPSHAPDTWAIKLA